MAWTGVGTDSSLLVLSEVLDHSGYDWDFLGLDSWPGCGMISTGRLSLAFHSYSDLYWQLLSVCKIKYQLLFSRKVVSGSKGSGSEEAALSNPLRTIYWGGKNFKALRSELSVNATVEQEEPKMIDPKEANLTCLRNNILWLKGSLKKNLNPLSSLTRGSVRWESLRPRGKFGENLICGELTTYLTYAFVQLIWPNDWVLLYLALELECE